MKKLSIFCIAAIVLVACNQPILDDEATSSDVQALIIDNPLPPPIVINPFTRNPYAVSTMRDAFLELQAGGVLPTGADIDDYIYTSHLYIKFSPESDEQIDELLSDSTMILYTHPIDNETTEINDEYTIRPEENDTTVLHFYTAVPSDKVLPTNIPYTILEELYIPDECVNTPPPSMKTVSGNDISENTINNLVDKAFEISGDIIFFDPLHTPNAEQMSNSDTERWCPAGNISAYDDIWGGQVPLQGIKVRARSWFTTLTDVTDENGNFACDGYLKRAAVYSFNWKGDKWVIRDGKTMPAHYNGPKSKGYWNLCIESGKSLAYAAIHRAAYRWYHGNVKGLTRPNHEGRAKFQYFHSPNENGDTVGGYVSTPTAPTSPTIKIWGKENGYNLRPFSRIFKTVCHELGHVAHDASNHHNFRDAAKTVKEIWARCCEFLLTNQEYDDRNALEKLYDYTFVTIAEEVNGEIITRNKQIMIPDDYYNYQTWKTDSNEQVYIPLCIDLVDDYNQFEYYVVRNLYNSSNTGPNVETNEYLDPTFPQPYIPSEYPIDNVCIPPQLIESFVFNNTSIDGIKNTIMQYIQNHPDESATFNLTEHSVGQLFYNYGY